MNSMKTAIVVLLTLVSWPVMAMDLLDTYRLAQSNDPAWRATLNTYLAEQQNEAIAKGGLLPSVSAFGTINRSRFEPATVPQQFLSTSVQYSLSLRQPVFSPERWARYQQAEVSITTSREELSAILGQPVGELAELRQDLDYEPPYPVQIMDWEALAKTHNPNIAVARLRADVAEQNRQIQRAGHQPRLDLVGSASENRPDLALQSFSEGRNLSVGLELSIPIYSGGQVTRSVRQAAYQADAARDQVTASERQATSQVRSAFLNLQADQARLAARQAAVESGEVVAEASQVGYELGVRNIVEVLLAQRSAFAARRDFIAARYDYVINVLRLRAAAGQLTATDLAEINTWLK